MKHKDDTIEAMNAFFKVCEDERIVPQPSFINYSDNTLFFVEQKIDQKNAEAIKEYLVKVKNVCSKKVS